MVTYGYILVTGWLHEVQFVDEFAGDLRGQTFAVVSVLSLLELSFALGGIEQVLFATKAGSEDGSEDRGSGPAVWSGGTGCSVCSIVLLFASVFIGELVSLDEL
jgi:hypothetical protein